MGLAVQHKAPQQGHVDDDQAPDQLVDGDLMFSAEESKGGGQVERKQCRDGGFNGGGRPRGVLGRGSGECIGILRRKAILYGSADKALLREVVTTKSRSVQRQTSFTVVYKRPIIMSIVPSISVQAGAASTNLRLQRRMNTLITAILIASMGGRWRGVRNDNVEIS